MSALPSDINLAEFVQRADEAAKATDDPERQQIAFERVLDYLLAGATPPPSPNGADLPRATEQSDQESPLGSAQQRSDEVAAFFGIDSERVGDLFELTDEEPQLVLSPKDLDGKSAPDTRKVALLVTGVRSALGLDTSTEHIRESARRLHALDTNNFKATLGKMAEIALMGSPSAKSRPVRLKTAGVASARDLVAALTSE